MVLLSTTDLERNYVDRGIQATGELYVGDPAVQHRTPRVDKAVHADQSLLEDSSNSDVSRDFPLPEQTSPFTGIHSVTVSAVRRIPRRRTRRYPKLGHALGDPSNSPRGPTARVVSMPETAPTTTVKHTLDAANLRIASMSERPKPDMLSQDGSSQDGFEASASTENSYMTADEDPHCSRRRAKGVPHTPSPPSSPESVMIIENSVHLPQAFLRRNSNMNHTAYSDNDDGWVTWANSPPRPIPALHGPLSLPYARCPSGAEGTIIEGPDDLPRMIWGLDEIHSTRVTSHHTPHHLAHRPAANTTAPILSPRIPKTRKQSVQGHTIQARPQNVEPSAPLLPMANGQDHSSQSHNAVHQRILQRLGSKASSDQAVNEAGFKITPRRSITLHDHLTRHPEASESDWHVRDTERGLGLDWQSGLTCHEQISSGLSGGRQIAEFLRSSAQPFVPGGVKAGHTYPRIFVEPRPNEFTQTSQRPSALELAHQHRQLQYQNALPTPPSSSSTQWSPYFSSYQDSSDSPDLTSLPPRLSAVHSQSQYYGNGSYQLHRFLHNKIGNIDLTGKTTTLGASVLVDSARSPRSSIQYSPDVSVSLAKFLQHRGGVFSPSVTTPPHPGPPPNTPLPPIPDHKHASATSVLLVTPPSPTTPETRSRCSSYLQPRSVPLARLLQRRLSSVPEEDLGAFSERPPSPSLVIQDNSFSHLQAQALAGWQPHQVDEVHLVRTPSPVAQTLAPQTRSPDVMAAKRSLEGLAKVKLPNQPHVDNTQRLGPRVAAPHFKKKFKSKRFKQQAPLKSAVES